MDPLHVCRSAILETKGLSVDDFKSRPEAWAVVDEIIGKQRSLMPEISKEHPDKLSEVSKVADEFWYVSVEGICIVFVHVFHW